MKEKTIISVIINGSEIQCSLSKNTTCNDVIKMTAQHKPQSQSSCNFAVFESAYGVQKMLPGQTKLLKQIRSWGLDSHKYSLEVREVDEVKSKMVSVTRAKSKLQRLRRLMKQHLKSEQKLQNDLNLVSNVVNKENRYYNKNITVINKKLGSQSDHVIFGKTVLLQKYLEDSLEINVTSDTERLSERNVDLDSINESQLPERTPGDDEDKVDYNIPGDAEQSMNKAFIARETFIENMSNSELNDCIIYETDTTDSDDESAFEDDSDYESICELERNITESCVDSTFKHVHELKRIFSNGDLNARITEDNLLESFMNTFANDGDSDEGVSSVKSDCE